MKRAKLIEGRPAKHRDLMKCVCCAQGMMANGDMTFYRVTLERMCVDMAAVQQQSGLEMMLGGNARLANVMGPDADIAKPLGPGVQVFVCDRCAIDNVLMEVAALAHEAADEESSQNPTPQPKDDHTDESDD